MKSTDLNNLSNLSYLNIPEQDAQNFENSFNSILDYIQELNSIDINVDTIKPTYYTQYLREDVELEDWVDNLEDEQVKILKNLFEALADEVLKNQAL